MPTYVCYAHRGQLTVQHKAQIAAGIARIHSEFTGAPVAFTQCVFHELNPHDHFIGVQPASENGVWVYGHIRSKRSISTRNEILLEFEILSGKC